MLHRHKTGACVTCITTALLLFLVTFHINIVIYEKKNLTGDLCKLLILSFLKMGEMATLMVK